MSEGDARMRVDLAFAAWRGSENLTDPAYQMSLIKLGIPD
jgi:hypothetical protein